MFSIPPLRKVIRADDYLVQGLAAGIPQVLDEMYKRFYPLVERFVCKNSGTPEDSRDVFQDVLMAIYYNTQQEDFQLTCAFETYLYSVCRNLWFKELRKRKVMATEFQDDLVYVDREELDDTRERWERYELYRKCFKEIGDKCQKLLKLYMQGLDMKSISERMGFGSTSYTRKRKFLCKEKLMNLIQDDAQYQNLVSFE